MRIDVAVIETWEGLCAIAFGRCRCCGWEGVDAFDVGLRALNPERTEFEWDEDVVDGRPDLCGPQANCPSCGAREMSFPDGLTPPVVR